MLCVFHQSLAFWEGWLQGGGDEQIIGIENIHEGVTSPEPKTGLEENEEMTKIPKKINE